MTASLGFAEHRKGILVRALEKPLFWLIAGIGLVLALLVAKLLLVDVDVYRAPIEQRITRALGREVVFGGRLELEPSLTPRLVINGLKIANPQWASRPYLAEVDRFDIRVSLLPLLRGELEVVALQLHGVDVLLEQAADGGNNFTFGESGDSAALPTIEHLSLYGALIGFAPDEGPVRRLGMEQMTLRSIAGEPVELEARTTVNAVPVSVAVRADGPSEGRAPGPWDLSLWGEVGELSLRVEGTMADAAAWRQGRYRFEVEGHHLDDLEALFDVSVPPAQPIELSGDIDFELDEHVTVRDLDGRIGASAITGELGWGMVGDRPAVTARLSSQRLDLGDIGLGDTLAHDADRQGDGDSGQPFDLGGLGAVDLDLEVAIQQLEGLERTVENLVLSVTADNDDLGLRVAEAKLLDTQISAKLSLPWGERLARLVPGPVDLETLIEHMDLNIRAEPITPPYRLSTGLLGRPIELTFSAVDFVARPGEALVISSEAAVNDKPVTASLRGEPLAQLVQRLTGPWRELALDVRGEGIRLDASGSVARPLELAGFDIGYELRGDDLSPLLPLPGALQLSGRYVDHPDRHVLDQLSLRIGRSDITGRVVAHGGEGRSRLEVDLQSDRIDLDEVLPDQATGTSASSPWDQPVHLGALPAADLDLNLRVRRLEGLAKPIEDVRLSARTTRYGLTIAPVEATLDEMRLEGRVQLPWGGRLAALAQRGISLEQLIRQAEVTVKGSAPEGTRRYQTALVGHPAELALTDFEATALPDKDLHVTADLRLNDEPVTVKLQGQPLAAWVQRPKGPWSDLAVHVHAGDIRVQAKGRVDRPFEAQGFDIRFALQGAEIDALLPLFDLVLPLEGAYSLTGHFAGDSDRLVFDELEIRSGRSDIGGRISVYRGQQRPRMVARLGSEQLYLRELLPVSETEMSADAQRRVIPDYELPIERMRQIDGELRFEAKRLRTVAGDLGDLSLTATLDNGVFKIDPLTVRGWAGGLSELVAVIDASQDPPSISSRWTVRQLDYGALLRQTGFVEQVTGTLDVTFRMSGRGSTRYEILSNANGKLVIVGEEGIFGSRRLDLWGSDLVTTMLSPQWRREDVTHLNCLVASVSIEDGIARSDDLLIDTQRITIGAAGTLDLETEELDLVFAPSPKRASLVSLTNPVRVSGTLAAPEVAVTTLPRTRVAAAGIGAVAGLINPALLVFTFSRMGTGEANPCVAAVEQAMVLKGRSDELDDLPKASPAH